jgi:site-specific DNA recombinase
MKTKKESKDSLAKLSEPWRNIGKGEQVESKKAREEQPKFLLAPYIRLSPTGDEREEGSLVSHPQRIRQFIESKNLQHNGSWGDVVDWYVDKDLSGKDMNRPSFQRMLGDIRAGRINAVIVTELSRLNRKVKDFCEVWDFFKEHNVALFSLKENFDTSTPMGELMLIQAMSFAQFERQTIVDRIKKGARARAERGLANGFIPLGFKPVEHRPNHRAVDATERAYVEMIFQKFLEFKRLNLLVTYLNGKGYRTKEFVTKHGKKVGGNRWTISSIHALLTNRCYIGEREVNKKFRAADPDKTKDEDRYFFVDAQWPALVSKDLFFDVQRLLEQNKKKARRYTHEYRLTGTIECAECGARLIGKSGTGKNGKYFYYGHMRKMVTGNDRHLHRCKIENVPALQLEEALIARLKDLSTDRDLVLELIRSTSSDSKGKLEHQKTLMAVKEQERRKLEQKVKNLYDAISEESDREVRAGLSQAAKEAIQQLELAKNALEDIKRDYDQSNNVVDISDAMEFIRVFNDGAFDAQPVAAQAEILKNRVRRIVVRDNGVYVEVFGRPPEPILRLIDGGLKKENPTQSPEGSRSGVRTVSKLVEMTGIEPAT